MLAQSIILSSMAAIASAATVKVQVSDASSTLAFTPNSIKASVGDVVEFTFFPKNHTVAQSSFGSPCSPLAGGFFSGYVPSAAGASNKTFSVTVKDTKPIWYYCSQSKHCNSGMVGVINPP
jgi:plastocyanin